MKRSLIVFLLFFTLVSGFFAGAGEGPYWSNDFRKTRLKAREEKKNLFLLFTISDGDYKNTRAIQLFRYSSAFLKEAKGEFCFLHIDLPKNRKLSWDLAAQNRRLKNRFGVSFFPAIVIVSPSSPWGGLLYRYNGVPSSWQELLEEVRKKVKTRKSPPAVRVWKEKRSSSEKESK